MIDEVAETSDPEQWVSDLLDRGDRIMGFGHRVYRAEDPRARLLARTAEELGSPGVEAARARVGCARRPGLRHPERVLATNVEYWAAVVLDVAESRRSHAGHVCVRARCRVVGAHPRAEARGLA